MDRNQEHLQDIKEIRNMMERSTRFLSLSGLSGVFAGLYALAGVAAGVFILNIGMDASPYYRSATQMARFNNYSMYILFVGIGLLVLAASLITGTLLTLRNSRKQNTTMWNSASKRLLINLLIPLGAGGFFCLILLYHDNLFLVAPATLIFYGLALLNASKYTFNDIRYLGICEIALGLIASVYVGYGLVFWAIGFGLLHILYGISMYNKYEKD